MIICEIQAGEHIKNSYIWDGSTPYTLEALPLYILYPLI